ncbi:MAG: CGCGG family rSAM-modified RiPP protein [Halobacteria archaeon]|nr:CGCGG family rSAM-modified RiPP protein [Halobacteria archaeon]
MPLVQKATLNGITPNKFGNDTICVSNIFTDMKIDSTVENGKLRDYDGEPREYTWSVNLELPEHGEDKDLVLREAKEAVRQTADGYFVNLVTHSDHGHPSGYLYDELRDEFEDSVEIEYVDQCGCGGYVTRVHV